MSPCWPASGGSVSRTTFESAAAARRRRHLPLRAALLLLSDCCFLHDDLTVCSPPLLVRSPRHCHPSHSSQPTAPPSMHSLPRRFVNLALIAVAAGCCACPRESESGAGGFVLLSVYGVGAAMHESVHSGPCVAVILLKMSSSMKGPAVRW